MAVETLPATARKMTSRIILAADESDGTIKKRLASIGLESTRKLNRFYRELLFTSGIEEFVSGVILFDETIRQKTKDGIPFAQFLNEIDIVAGIKVDGGLKKLPGQTIDTYTQGIDGLGDRLAEYREIGAKFAKWRAVITISSDDGGHPTIAAVERNAHDLALYAAICQDNGLVPIVEPEVFLEGSHSLEDCAKATEWVLSEVFGRLDDYKVSLSGMILKPNMITSGSKAKNQASREVVAQTTLNVLRNTVSADVPGIAFLSGGQSPDLATQHLNEINKLKNQRPDDFPWELTASFGRALQEETLKTWLGKDENVNAAQNALLARAGQVFNARNGTL